MFTILLAEGYFNTYDLAKRDAEGNIQITGRVDDAIRMQGVWLEVRTQDWDCDGKDAEHLIWYIVEQKRLGSTTTNIQLLIYYSLPQLNYLTSSHNAWKHIILTLLKSFLHLFRTRVQL